PSTNLTPSRRPVCILHSASCNEATFWIRALHPLFGTTVRIVGIADFVERWAGDEQLMLPASS
ncbi:MAG TPA: hypothetical protein PK156_44665, partial [Polyangium sp.]|nr:hypothetical protein [Polyangium sp.]